MGLAMDNVEVYSNNQLFTRKQFKCLLQFVE